VVRFTVLLCNELILMEIGANTVLDSIEKRTSKPSRSPAFTGASKRGELFRSSSKAENEPVFFHAFPLFYIVADHAHPSDPDRDSRSWRAGIKCGMLLARSGFERFTVADFDTVEASNLNANLSSGQIGKLKTTCFVEIFQTDPGS